MSAIQRTPIGGSFMICAYGWALLQPACAVSYNLTPTGISVVVTLVVGTIEGGSLGFVIVAMFLATWPVVVAARRPGRIEERWPNHLRESGGMQQ